MFPILNENSSKIGQYSVQKHRTTEIQQNLLELSAYKEVYKDAVFTNDDEYSQYVQSQHFTETCHHISSSH